MPLKLAKFSRPETGDALLREHLFARLDAARSKPVVWVGAPAGAGKTTLVSSYVESRNCRTLWYQIDACDGDPASFFHHLGKALATTIGSRKTMPALTPEYRLGLAAFARHYFRELFQRLGESSLLVLDDYQEAGDESEIDDLLALASEEIPAGVNLIVIGRTRPPAAFSRLRATRRLDELTWTDLRFTIDEQWEVARRRLPRQRVSRRRIQLMDAHLQGWVTGLVLTMELGDADPAVDFDEHSSQQHLFDYFASEILSRFDAEIQRFLLETSILPRMTAGICRRLTGNGTAGRILADLVRRQYFTVTVRHGRLRRSYVYHPLFRRFLQHQAEERLGEDGLRRLQGRAGLLLASAGGVDEAAELLIRAENWQALGDLVLENARQQLRHGRNRQLANWLERLPEPFIEQRPWLSYWLGMARLQYDNRHALALFEDAYRRFKRERNAKGLYLSWCGISDAYRFAHNGFQGAGRWLDELDWLQKTCPRPVDLELRGHLVLSATGLLLWVRPDHPDLPKWIGRLEMLYRHVPDPQLKVFCAGQLCIHYSQMGETERLRRIGRCLDRLETEATAACRAIVMALKCSIDWLTGELKMSDALIDEQQEFMRDRGVNIYNGLSLSQSLYHATCRRDPERIERLLERYADDIADGDLLGECYFQLHACNLQIVRNDFDQAFVHCRLAIDLAEQSAVPFARWFARSLAAYLNIELRQYTQASRHLETAQEIVVAMKSPPGIMMADMIRSYLAYRQHDIATARRFLTAGFRRARAHGIHAGGVWPPRMMSTLCSLALDHDIETDYAHRLIQIYDYRPRDAAYAGEYWPWFLRIYTLGRFSVVRDGRPLDPENRPFALLKALLACGGRNVHENAINDMLWPEVEGDQAASRFKVSLHRLRKTLGKQDILVLKNRRLSLNEHHVWVDTWALHRQCAEAEGIDDDSDPRQMRHLLCRLLRLYRGDFLANDPVDWALKKRENLRNHFIHHGTALARRLETRHAPDAVYAYQRLLEIEPLLEPAYQGLIRCHQAQDRHAEARAWFEKCVETLAMAGSAPSEATVALLGTD